MKIELLLEREPFWEILFNTLDSYYQNIDGKKRNFTLKNKRTKDLFNKDILLVNSKLNIIFNPYVNKNIFSQTKKEFSYHPNILKRWVQTAYVNLAITFPFSIIFANHILEIDSFIPHSNDILILGGNNRLRIIDLQSNLMIVILKNGFNRYFFENEILLRKNLLNLDIPKLISSNSTNSFFTEEIISGTPINRLHNNQLSEKALKQAISNIQKMYNQTIKTITLSQYVSQLQNEVNILIKNDIFSSISDRVKKLSNQILSFKKNGKTIDLAMTHGDFQDANILLDKDNIWLIDWENAKKRSINYDTLTYVLNARILNQFHNTYIMFSQQARNKQYDLFKKYLSNLDDQDIDQVLRIFLVENLIFALQQNNNENFYSFDKYLIDYLNILEDIIQDIKL